MGRDDRGGRDKDKDKDKDRDRDRGRDSKKEETGPGGFKRGQRLKIHSLKAKPEFNGAVVECIGWDSEKGAWEVKHPDMGATVKLKADNLEAADRSRSPPRKEESRRTAEG